MLSILEIDIIIMNVVKKLKNYIKIKLPDDNVFEPVEGATPFDKK